MSLFLADTTHEFRRHKMLCDQAMGWLDDATLIKRPAENLNSVALIVKHLAGNLKSRWTDFLTSDGDKPDRNRDGEFEWKPEDSRQSLMTAWENGWTILFESLASLKADDLDKTIFIRGEPHRVQQAILRGLDHVAYHTGQILLVARWLAPDSPYLTIAPNKSVEHRANYWKT